MGTSALAMPWTVRFVWSRPLLKSLTRRRRAGFWLRAICGTPATSCFRADVFLAELARFEPAIAEAAGKVAASIAVDKVGNLSFERIDRDAFAASPSKSVDYAVMERTDRAAVIKADYAWSDLGSWDALWAMSDKDAEGNAIRGEVSLVETRNSYVASDDLHTAVIGLEDIAVVATKDAVLVAKRSVAGELKNPRCVFAGVRGNAPACRRASQGAAPLGLL